MASNRRYYWIKLREDFLNGEVVDFLMAQKNGSKYVVLYLMLCMNTKNNEGRLYSTFGEMIVPFDAEKIVRDTKYFDIDTVTVAMSLYKKLGLIYEDSNGCLMISDYENIVGSETYNAIHMREKRKHNNVMQMLPKSYVDKDKEIDKEIEKDIDKDIYSPAEAVPYREIVEYLNIRVGAHYRATTNKTRSLIKARINEGFTFDDFKTVIDKKSQEWLNTDYERYLRPETLFGNKFESYLNQKPKKMTTKELAPMLDFSEFDV